ncbi:MAG: hypothetical protein HKN68_16590 [Saprospiraceae bacterium]|nr:hypothetical protein [Saprospiraceae bacterium]
MNNKPILLLDLGGVVFTSSGSTNSIIDWSIINELNEVYAHDLNLGKDVFLEFLNVYNQKMDLILDGYGFFDNLFTTISYNEKLVSFAQAHFRIFIVSDNYRENIQFINQKYGMESWAEKQFYSFDLGSVKEEEIFFKKLKSELGIPLGQLVFVDDSPLKIFSAQKNGIKSILHTENNNTINQLERFLNGFTR